MANKSKLSLIARIQRWMDSVSGQTFLNYAYSWGAAIVILGTLFKLTHIAGANLMLFIGMGTEVFVFFISAFDRPFDKSGEASVREDHEMDDEEYDTPADGGHHSGAAPSHGVYVQGGAQASAYDGDDYEPADATVEGGFSGGTVVVGGTQGGGTVIIGGGAGSVAGTPAGGTSAVGTAATVAPEGQDPAAGQAAGETPVVDTIISNAISAAMPEGSEEADRLANIIRMANDELLHRAQAVLSPDMEAASQEYIEKLRTLTATLQKVDEQSERLTRDSQEMENLNRTLIGINKIYELHFASISKQVTTIEQINDQTRELAAKIDEVNKIYARMMQQLNIMANPAAGLNTSEN